MKLFIFNCNPTDTSGYLKPLLPHPEHTNSHAELSTCHPELVSGAQSKCPTKRFRNEFGMTVLAGADFDGRETSIERALFKRSNGQQSKRRGTLPPIIYSQHQQIQLRKVRVKCVRRFFAFAQNDRVCKKAAFTLAEVLITLGIIGVVAAITIPMLITKYQKFQTVTRLKGIYSQLSQAIRLSEDENGDLSGWDLSAPDWFDRYLASYVKASKIKLKDVNDGDSIFYKQLSGARENGLAILTGAELGGSSSYLLLNGAQIFVADTYRLSSESAGMIIDINGAFTPPNQFGKDTFYFYVYNKYGLKPMGMHNSQECTPPIDGNPGREYLMTSNCLQYACNKKSRGMFCAALIFTDGWTISKDYPW